MHAKAQGWTPMILDTNGNGKRDEYVEPNQPVDPTKDKRIVAGFYAVMPSPADGSVWGHSGPISRSRGAAHARQQSLGDRADGNLQRPAARIRISRRRHRQARRRLGIAGERSSRAASTGASAKVRSTGRRPPAIIVPKAGVSINIPVPVSRSSAKTAPSRAITPGSTSTTPSASATMCRCLRPI